MNNANTYSLKKLKKIAKTTATLLPSTSWKRNVKEYHENNKKACKNKHEISRENYLMKTTI